MENKEIQTPETAKIGWNKDKNGNKVYTFAHEDGIITKDGVSIPNKIGILNTKVEENTSQLDNIVTQKLDNHTLKWLTKAQYSELEQAGTLDPLTEYHITDSNNPEVPEITENDKNKILGVNGDGTGLIYTEKVTIDISGKQDKNDEQILGTEKNIVKAINANKTSLNGYKFVDTPSSNSKEIYLVENTSPIIPNIAATDNGKVLKVKSDGTGLEYSASVSGGLEPHRHNANEIDNLPTHTHQLVLNGTDLELYISGIKISTVSLSGLGGGGNHTIYGNIVIDKLTVDITEGNTGEFTVSLDKEPTNNQEIALTNTNTNISLNPSILTFTPANYSTPQTITVTPLNGIDYSSQVDDVITLTSPNVLDKTVDICIVDNDGEADPFVSFTVNRDIDISSFAGIVNSTVKGIGLEYYNYLAEFKVSNTTLFSVGLTLPKISPTSDYLHLTMKDGSLKLVYSRAGTIRMEHVITKTITTNTVFKFMRNECINSLYIDDVLEYEYDERDYSQYNPNYIKTAFGVVVISPATEADTSQIASLSVKYKANECIDIPKSDTVLQNEITNYVNNPSQYYVFDDFNRANGTLTTTTNGLTYTTDSTMPTISTNMANANGGNKALLEIGANEYTIYADLRSAFNGHYLYLRYVDSTNYIALSFGGNDKTALVKCVEGAKTTTSYTIFNTSTEKYIVKADVRGGKITLNCNNQDVLKNFDISEVSSTKVGFGANLANCKFDTLIVKK